MSIVILVYGKKFSEELLKDVFLVHFYSIYVYIYIYIYSFEYHQKFVLEDGTFGLQKSMSIRNNNRFLLNLLFPLKQLSEKVPNKLNALTRITPYLSYNQRRLIYSSFITGKLSYFLF